jgi:hypothetical protein
MSLAMLLFARTFFTALAMFEIFAALMLFVALRMGQCAKRTCAACIAVGIAHFFCCKHAAVDCI